MSGTPLANIGGSIGASGASGALANLNPFTRVMSNLTASPIGQLLGAGAGGTTPNTLNTPDASSALSSILAPLLPGTNSSPNLTTPAPLDQQGSAAVQPAATRSTSGAASPKGQQIVSDLQRRGLDNMHASVLAGNMQQESSFNPKSWNANEGAGGMIQWRQDRLANLKSFAAQQGKDWQDPNVQMDFIIHEGQTTEKGAWDKFLAAKTPEEANAALKGYIRYGDNSQPTRLSNAQAFLNGNSTSAAGHVAGIAPQSVQTQAINTQPTQPLARSAPLAQAAPQPKSSDAADIAAAQEKNRQDRVARFQSIAQQLMTNGDTSQIANLSDSEKLQLLIGMGQNGPFLS